MAYPKVTCDLNKLLENVNKIADIMHAEGRTFAAVSKSFSAEERIVEMLNVSRCDWIADSHSQNFVTMKTNKPRFLLRITQPWEVPQVIACTEYTFESEVSTIALLGAEAKRQGKKHGVIVALDMGDLREGCYFKDMADIERTVEAVLREDSLTLAGVGTNLGCFGGVMCSKENMEGICAIAEHIRSKYRVALPYVSGMSTLSHKMLFAGEMPKGVTHGRFGEAWMTGGDAVNICDVPGMNNDGFIFSAQVVEVKQKDSKPVGQIGADAFGHVIERPDLGPMRRGIIACGAHDIDRDYLVPLDERIEILGGSSDHTLLNLSNAPDIKVGDVLHFRMRWGAVLRAYGSRYVEKEFIALK